MTDPIHNSVRFDVLRHAFREAYARDCILTDQEIFNAGEWSGAVGVPEWVDAMDAADQAKRDIGRLV